MEIVYDNYVMKFTEFIPISIVVSKHKIHPIGIQCTRDCFSKFKSNNIEPRLKISLVLLKLLDYSNTGIS